MSAPPYSLAPRMGGVPDARRAPWPLVDPVVIGYLAFALGLPVAGLAALYNAAILRRPGLALISLLVALGGWLAFWPAFVMLWSDARPGGLIFLGLKLVVACFGIAIAVLHWAHARGHRHLGGPSWPVLHLAVGGMVLAMLAPTSVKVWLVGYLWESL